MVAVKDRGEVVPLMEPMMIAELERERKGLNDLALNLATRAARLDSSLPIGIREALADMVRSMNCYYSNLIEGHDTHPIDIDRALREDYSDDAKKRDLQLEARAHIQVQSWIDGGGLRGRETSQDGIREIHRRFCEALPDTLLWVEDPGSKEKFRIQPGEYRTRDVRVGRHEPISAGAVPRFVHRFEAAYAEPGRVGQVLSAAAAHHRLLWIHPFLDGNGRVARLMSHAILLSALKTAPVWSVARGLSRRVGEYKGHLMQCDLKRRNDLDGRGNLSEEALVAFTRFFLEICIDQVDFMEKLMDPGGLRERILRWASDEASVSGAPVQARKVLETLLYRGELPRGDVPELLETSDRHARRVTGWLQEQGALVSEGPRAPFRLAFPGALASRWMPGLFPA